MNLSLKKLICIAFVFCAFNTCSLNASWWSNLFRDTSIAGGLDITQDDNNVIVTMDVPKDIDPEDIVVEIKDFQLRVHGKGKKKEEVHDEGYYKKEVSSSSFNRSVSLPCFVDDTATEAELHNTTLIITMPKINQEENANKKIRVVRK